MIGTLDKLRRHWSVLPRWIKALPVGALWATLCLVMAWSSHHDQVTYHLVQRLLYLPLFMAALLYGLKGGLIMAVMLGLNYLPFLGDHPPIPQPEHGLAAIVEVGLLFLTGAITGVLADREQRELKRVKEMESLALLGQAAASVAHELKSPLVAIGGFAQRMRRDLADDHPHAEQLRIIVEQTRHMEGLLREMLDYTRPMKLVLQRCSLEAVFAEVRALTAVEAEKAKVGLVVEPVNGLYARADCARLKQVLMNLTLNAVQASGPGTQVRLGGRLQGEWVRLEISDRGKGIEARHQDKIFYPFFTTKPGGTGLGLPVSLKIVEAHGGTMEVDSVPGQGCTFKVTLPAAA